MDSENDKDAQIVDYLYGASSDAALEDLIRRTPSLRDEVEADAKLLLAARRLDLSAAPPPGLARLALGAARRRPIPWFRRFQTWLVGSALGLSAAAVAATGLFLAFKPVAPVGESMRSRSIGRASEASSLDRSTRQPNRSRAEPTDSEMEPIQVRIPKRRRPFRAEPSPLPASSEEKSMAPEGPGPGQIERFGRPEAKRETRLRARASDRIRSAPRSSVGRAPAGLPLDVDPAAKDGDRTVSGRQREAGRLLIQRAQKAKKAGRFGEARRSLNSAASRVYALPMLGEVLLLRAEVELEDQQYVAAQTFAKRAIRVTGFTETERAREIVRRARDLETNVTP